MYMKRLIAVSALAGGIAASFAAGGGAGASAPSYASPEVGMEVLDMMCVEQGGHGAKTSNIPRPTLNLQLWAFHGRIPKS